VTKRTVEYTNPIRYGMQWIVYYYYLDENDARQSNPFETRREAADYVRHNRAPLPYVREEQI
jgi:hypothetical protein